MTVTAFAILDYVAAILIILKMIPATRTFFFVGE